MGNAVTARAALLTLLSLLTIAGCGSDGLEATADQGTTSASPTTSGPVTTSSRTPVRELEPAS